MIAISYQTALDEFTKELIFFSELRKKYEEEWADEGKVPETVMFSDFAFQFARSIDQFNSEDLKKMFELLENYIINGSDVLQAAVATGFFERLLSEEALEKFDFQKILPFIQMKSFEYCKSWNEFLGVNRKWTAADFANRLNQ